MNTLTNLIPDVYRALDVVSRELSGFIPAVTVDAQAARAAVGQSIRVPIAPAAAAENVTPATNPPDTGDQVIDNTPITITKSRAVPFRWTGEEVRGVNFGVGYLTLRQAQIAQAFRTLVNEVEADLAALYTRSSRAYGTAGTAPFGTTPSIGDSAQLLKILLDNGAPSADLQLVIDTTAGANLRSLSNLFKVNEAGDENLLRQGVLGDLHGFAIRESAQVKLHTKGTGTAYQANGALALGATTMAVDTGSGTLVAGDIITIANGTPADTHKYVANTTLSAGSFLIGGPGLRSSHVDNDAFTIGNNYRANLAFHRSAMILVARPPALPEEGDMAADRMVIQDPRTGLAFELSMYLQYRRVRYELALAWGTANIKPEHTATLLG